MRDKQPISKDRSDNDRQLALDWERPSTYEVEPGEKLPPHLTRRYDQHDGE